MAQVPHSTDERSPNKLKKVLRILLDTFERMGASPLNTKNGPKSTWMGRGRALLLGASLFFSLCIGQASAQSPFQELTPSFVLDSGVFEGKLFGQLYTQAEAFSTSGERVNLDRRSSYLTGIGQFLYGLKPGVNVGVETWGHSVKLGKAGTAPHHFLKSGSGQGRRSTLSYLGPRVKFAPKRNWKNTSIELALLFPVAPDLESRRRDAPFVAEDRYSLIAKGFYDRELTRQLRLFIRLMPWLSIDRKLRNGASYFSSPISAFLSYIPTERLTLYSQSEWWPTYGRDPLINSSFFQQGLGLKYMLIEEHLELELLYSRFLFGRNVGAGQSLNLGGRVLF